MHLSNSAEWYTPDVILERAKLVLGRIDLDPASCEAANERVGATTICTKEDNGLEHDWRPYGTIFLNPPGDKRGALPKAFWNKLYETYMASREEKTGGLPPYRKGNLRGAIYVGFSLEQLRYLERIKFASTAILKKRVKYLRPDGIVGESPAHGSFVSFLGDQDIGQRFYSEFKDISNVLFL